MGVASESFIILIGWAGFVAAIFLAYSIITRLQRGQGNRGVFQRMPLLLPSIAFVISVFIIMQIGVIPIQDYRGENIQDSFLYSGAECEFNVFEPRIAYTEDVSLTVQSEMEPEESVDIVLNFYLGSALLKSVVVNLTSGENESVVSEERTLDLEPGHYVVRAEVIFYYQGEIIQSYDTVQMSLAQETINSIYHELFKWTNYQFAINIGCFFFIIGGLCIGKEDRMQRKDENHKQNNPSSDEYRSYEQ